MPFAGRLGLVVPQDQSLSPAQLKELAQAAQASGVDYLAAASHDLGVDPQRHGERLRRDWPFPLSNSARGVPYQASDAFHEPLTLFAFLSAVCDLGLLTSVVVLPQRQTVALAKAAAEVDLLSSGRLVLGVGAGWNSVELVAAGGSWCDRFDRMEEQIEVLRLLWTQPLVDFTGTYHDLPGVSLNPQPHQRPIPIWIGSGASEGALARVARLADGWLPTALPGRGLEPALESVRTQREHLKRDPDDLRVHGVITTRNASAGDLARRADRWSRAGATHLAIDLRGDAGDLIQNLEQSVVAVRDGSPLRRNGDSEPC